MRRSSHRFVLASIAAMVALAGCSARYQLNASSNTIANGAAPGTSVSGGAVQVQSGGAAAVALLAIGVLALSSEYPPPPPELAAGRRVNEQDCTRPVDLSAGNLRCK